MRDKSRIEFFLLDVGDIWKKHPDLRFGQIIENLRDYYYYKYGKDFYYVEEEEFLKIFKESLGINNVKKD